MDNLSQIPDNELLSLCRQYGGNALLWRRKFESLLPEVFRRRLYEKENCSNIYEFAAKFAGLSEAQVNTVLHLEKRLQGKPILLGLFHEAEVSTNKLVRVLTVATEANQEDLAQKLKIFSQKTMEIYVRDLKREQNEAKELERKNSPNLFLGTNLLRAQKKLDFILSDEVTDKLNLIHAQGKDISVLLLNFLNQKKQETERKEQELSTRAREETHLPSRNYYKKAIRDFLNEKYGTKCAVSGCTKPAEEIHHRLRFGLQANNDPAYMVPLCKEHHKIAHAIDLKVVEHWKK
ncbi:MAG: hypothetical protein WC846_00645 [Candidatus Gracilibacteria bacterium]|jgi:hypothetical protein